MGVQLLLTFYQNEWTRFITGGYTLRQSTLMRWSVFFLLICELPSAWKRLFSFIYAWLPALGFYFFRKVVATKSLQLLPASKLLMPLPSLKLLPERRIFNWTRRYLVLLTWFFYFIYLMPLNRNSRIMVLPLNAPLRTTVWTFLWL
uniref:Uncharacterized protein ORF145 n=1 Tax=Moneuplotes minuta TaxID=74792 RepID=D1LDM6_9SPIT|nr:hypothetical protein [Moneuplotes minuta]